MMRSSVAPSVVQSNLSSKTPSKGKRKHKTQQFVVSDIPAQLMFLFDDNYEDEVLLPNSVKDGLATLTAIQPANDHEWTDDEIHRLHCYVLDQSLHQVFNPRTSMDTRIEIIEWIGSRTPRREEHKPLSFDYCCELSGYDAEELREQFLNEMKFRKLLPSLN